MKKIAIFFIASLSITLILVLSLFFQPKQKELISPVLKESKTIGVNLWFPKDVLGAAAPLKISAKAALFVDTSSGDVLFEKNAKDKLQVASLAKIMTVLTCLDYKDMDDKLLVSQKATEALPDEMILLPGERLTVKELLYGIFMISANDAAEVLAEGSVGGREEFIRLMNDKAAQLGMKDSYFANPTGLDEDNGSSYSTAYDLIILTRYAIRKYPELLEISKTPYIFIPETQEHQSYEMYSGINLLTTYPGVLGFKTGNTPEAGLTLITLAQKNGHEVIGVLLGSEDRRDEARELLDYSFGKLGSKGETF